MYILLTILILLFNGSILAQTAIVQIAAAPSPATAQKIADKMTGSFVVIAVVKGKTFYRVRVRTTNPAAVLAAFPGAFLPKDGTLKSIAEPTIIKPIKPTPVKPSPTKLIAVKPIKPTPPNSTDPLIAPPRPALVTDSKPVEPSPPPHALSAPPMTTYQTTSYQLLVPANWLERRVDYPDCEDGVMFIAPAGGAAIQVFTLNKNLSAKSDNEQIKFSLSVMARLTGTDILEVARKTEGNKITFNLILKGTEKMCGKATLLKGTQSLLTWAITRPSLYQDFELLISVSQESLTIKQ